jgi:hypothetical protein
MGFVNSHHRTALIRSNRDGCHCFLPLSPLKAWNPTISIWPQEGGDMSGIAFAIAVFLAVTSALGVPLPVSGIYRPAPKGLASSLRLSQGLPHKSGRRTCQLHCSTGVGFASSSIAPPLPTSIASCAAGNLAICPVSSPPNTSW